jgi:hypothetical protein
VKLIRQNRRKSIRARRITTASLCFAALATALLLAETATAHVLQQLSWYQIDRTITVQPNSLHIHHECKFDPNMFKGDDPIMDVDGDSTASRHEIAMFCQASGNYISQDFTVLADGLPCAVRQESFSVNDDDSGFSSDLVADTPDMPTSGAQTLDIVDPAFLFSFPMDRDSTSTVVVTKPPIVVRSPSGKSLQRIEAVRGPHITVRIAKASDSALTSTTATSTR